MQSAGEQAIPVAATEATHPKGSNIQLTLPTSCWLWPDCLSDSEVSECQKCLASIIGSARLRRGQLLKWINSPLLYQLSYTSINAEGIEPPTHGWLHITMFPVSISYTIGADTMGLYRNPHPVPVDCDLRYKARSCIRKVFA